MEIEEEQLLEIIYWARRYCDNRATYAPTRFNWIYDYIMANNPDLKEKDQFDSTLMKQGKYWPYAQDAMYSDSTGAYDARPQVPYKRIEMK